MPKRSRYSSNVYTDRSRANLGRSRLRREVSAEPVAQGFVSVLGESLSELGGDVCTICLDPSMIACADR